MELQTQQFASFLRKLNRATTKFMQDQQTGTETTPEDDELLEQLYVLWQLHFSE